MNRILGLLLMAALGLSLAACSYHDHERGRGHDRGKDHRHEQRHDHRHDHHKGDHHRHDQHCPPGQAKKGRC